MNIDNLTFRVATISDTKEIANLRWISHEEDNAIISEIKSDYITRCENFLNEGIENNSWFHWIVKNDVAIIGVISIFVFERLPAPDREHAFNGYITNVYVSKKYRRKGIGNLLMGNVKEWAMKKEINVLMLYSSEEGVPFYKKNGFTINTDFFNYVFNDD